MAQVEPFPQYQPPPGQTTVIVQNNVRPSSYLAFAICVTICCNIIFGIIAIIFSVMSSSAADDNNMEDARRNGKISLAFSLSGILITIIALIVGIYFIYVYTTQLIGTAFQEVDTITGQIGSLSGQLDGSLAGQLDGSGTINTDLSQFL
ncbi:hypothetical protein A3Q56_04429 [Intoshia linei]|uniref:Interferon-induced transmembrane protein n=1 Tax=Intoshia linei TaxID=1819745 RepID=A0A177B2B0_9BILA|nr:hypothetical protein A3Q56_04429 [Intoshia linei]